MDDNKWTSEIEQNLDRLDELDQGFHFGGNTKLYGTMAERSKK